MIVPSDSRLSPFKYVEVARYVPKLDRVLRDKVGDDPLFLEWGSQVEEYRRVHDNKGVYTSVFRYDKTDLSETTRIGSLYFDLDAEGNAELAHSDARKLFDYIVKFVPPEAIRVYFTGAKGFHIEVEAYTLGVDPSNELHIFFRYIAEQLKEELELTTVDFSVYDPRRMWRLPDSIHQKTGLYKVELGWRNFTSSLEDIKKFAAIDPASYEQPSVELDFSVKANEWYKSWVARYEEQRRIEKEAAAARRNELFGKYGTHLLKGHSKGYVNAVWRTVIETLKATTINRNMELSKQSYKMYLTLLEAGQDTEKATITLQEVGIDIGLEPREVDATLKSALRAAEKKHEEEPRSFYG